MAVDSKIGVCWPQHILASHWAQWARATSIFTPLNSEFHFSILPVLLSVVLIAVKADFVDLSFIITIRHTCTENLVLVRRVVPQMFFDSF